MMLSTKGRYGLKAMLELALQYDKGKCSIKQIAERQGLSENYLEQLFAVLKKQKLVVSTRGAFGGYSLSRPPEEISVGEVLRTLEGTLDPVDCGHLNDDKQCTSESYCVTKYVWKKISDSVRDVVDNISLKDLVNDFWDIKESDEDGKKDLF